MKRKLHLLNLALAALLALTGWRIWQVRKNAEVRSASLAAQEVKPAAAIPEPALDPPAPATAADYIEVAGRVLFTRDRNPEVEVVVIERPVPPLPVAYGVLDLGAGPTAILSAASGEPQRAYRVGDRIGEFRLLEATPRELVFGWEDKRIRKRVEDLKPEESAPAAQAAAPPPQQPPPSQTKVVGASPASKAAPSAIDMGGGLRACQPDDASPAGTVSGGYRKLVTETPFGKSCRWEPVQ
ncbi:MAG: hypothetical protein KIT09_25430 [Bryobacteraceae bacterium]|nr:hypothetical protein [Bryobacteraceae bacterium]